MKKDFEQNFFNLINTTYSFHEALLILDKINWDFKDYTTQYLSHIFHPYPARFIPQIPLSFIKLFTKEDETILDPFCGCGTTLVESFLNNRNAIGVDVNPIATLITKVKTTLIDQKEFEYFNKKLKNLFDCDYTKSNYNTNVVSKFPLPDIFDKIIVSKIENIHRFLLDIKEEGHNDLFDLGLVALSSIIWSLKKKDNNFDINKIFLKKVNFMQKILNKMEVSVKQYPKIQIFTDDVKNIQFSPNSIDLVITSPPYVNALSYYSLYMYNMLLLKIDGIIFKKNEIGSHSRFSANRFKLLTQYLFDLTKILIKLNKWLKQNKLCVFVIGNSKVEYELIENYKFLIEIGEKTGFKLLKIIFRNIDQKKKYNINIGKINTEYIVIMQKINDITLDNTEDFILNIVKNLMINFKENIEKSVDISFKYPNDSKERLLKNITKINEAINLIGKNK